MSSRLPASLLVLALAAASSVAQEVDPLRGIVVRRCWIQAASIQQAIHIYDADRGRASSVIPWHELVRARLLPILPIDPGSSYQDDTSYSNYRFGNGSSEAENPFAVVCSVHGCFRGPIHLTFAGDLPPPRSGRPAPAVRLPVLPTFGTERIAPPAYPGLPAFPGTALAAAGASIGPRPPFALTLPPRSWMPPSGSKATPPAAPRVARTVQGFLGN